jgi:hypothetical protein
MMDVRTVVEKILRSLCHSVTNRAYAEHKQTQCESSGKSQKSPLPYEYCARPCWSCFLRHRVHNISIRSETVMTWIMTKKAICKRRYDNEHARPNQDRGCEESELPDERDP